MEVALTGERGACNNVGRCNNIGHLPLCLHLCDQKQQSAIRAHIPIFGGWDTFCPASFLKAVCKLPPQTRTQLPATGSYTMLKARLTTIYCLSLPLEVGSLQWTLKFLNSCIRQILSAQLLSRWGGRFLMLLHHLPRILL